MSGGKATRGNPRRAQGAGLLADTALLVVSLAVGLGATRLVIHPGRAGLLLSVAAVVAAGHVATSASRRVPPPAPAPVAFGVLAVALTTVWTILPGTTFHGVPTLASLTGLAGHLRQADSQIAGHPTPLPQTSGVILLFAVLAGLIAVATRSIWALLENSPGWRRRPLVALIPSAGLFAYSSLFSSGQDRLPGVASYLGSVLLFVVVADQSRAPRPGRWRAAASGALVAGLALALTGAAAASPSISKVQLRAFVVGGGGGTGSGSGRGGSALGALDLIDNLRAVETDHPDSLVFTAGTPLPSYWQVGTLTTFDGTNWIPDGPTSDAADSAQASRPGVPATPLLPGPSGRPEFTASVQTTGWTSRLLPVPPETQTVSGAPGASLDPNVGVVLPQPPTSSLSYRANAAVPPDGNTVPDVPGPPPGADPATQAYLTLPPVADPVSTLAANLVSPGEDPAQMALSIQHFFLSGSFRYTLDPPPAAPGDPLSDFLFDSKAGFCQQFAGAYAVLARLDGLPTRLAVGFTPGGPSGANRYRITGADAHVWPEVYLGPDQGWVTVEATPGDGSGVGANPGPRAGTGPPPSSPPSSSPSGATTSTTRAPSAPTTQPAAGHHRGAGAVTGRGWLWAGGALVLILGAILLGAIRRRARRRRVETGPTGRDGPAGAVLGSWRQAARALDRAGLGRGRAETLAEHAVRLRTRARYGPGPDTATEAYAALALLAEEASYGPGPGTPGEAAEAARLSETVRRTLQPGATPHPDREPVAAGP